MIEDLFDGVTTTVVRSDRPEAVAVTAPHAEATVVAGTPTIHVDTEPSPDIGVDARALVLRPAFEVRGGASGALWTASPFAASLSVGVAWQNL